MKTEFVRFLFPMTALLLAAAAEEALPKILAVGFPILMTTALFLGRIRMRAEMVLLTAVAGVLEDAISALPLATTASFLLIMAFGLRSFPISRFAMMLVYPLYQLWLVVWTNLPSGALWGRLLVSLPVSAATALAVAPLLLHLERKLLADAR